MDAVPARDTKLEEELQRQQENEALRVQFAEIANEVGAYIESRSSALAELSMQGKDTMEEQLDALKEFQAETMGYQPKLDEAEAINQVGINRKELCVLIHSFMFFSFCRKWLLL